MRVTLIENEDGRLSADFIGGLVLFHVVLNHWGTSKYREYAAIFDWVLGIMALEGYKVVHAMPYLHDAKAQRLITLFGFRRIGRTRNHVVMERRIGARDA